jgi:hypothetical protein
VERLARALQKVLIVLIPCWCLVPVVIVIGFCFWAMIEAPWVWKPVFISGLLGITASASIWGVRLGEQLRNERESTRT